MQATNMPSTIPSLRFPQAAQTLQPFILAPKPQPGFKFHLMVRRRQVDNKSGSIDRARKVNSLTWNAAPEKHESLVEHQVEQQRASSTRFARPQHPLPLKAHSGRVASRTGELELFKPEVQVVRQLQIEYHYRASAR